MEGLDGKDFEEIRMFWGAEKNRAPLGIRVSTNSQAGELILRLHGSVSPLCTAAKLEDHLKGIFKLIKGPKVLCH